MSSHMRFRVLHWKQREHLHKAVANVVLFRSFHFEKQFHLQEHFQSLRVNASCIRKLVCVHLPLGSLTKMQVIFSFSRSKYLVVAHI